MDIDHEYLEEVLLEGDRVLDSSLVGHKSRNVSPRATTSVGVDDVDGLAQKLKVMQPQGFVGLDEKSYKIPWIESLVVTGGGNVGKTNSIDHSEDIARETLFHDTALANVTEGLRRLQGMKIKFSRPDDFMADMIKTDAQMNRVRRKISDEQQKVAAVQERRLQKVSKKFAKQVKTEKVQLNQAAKNKSIRQLEEWKKDRKGSKTSSSNRSAEDSLNALFDGDQQKGGGGGKKKRSATDVADSRLRKEARAIAPSRRAKWEARKEQKRSEVSFGSGKGQKRVIKDAKFGKGGPKRHKKQNDRESSARAVDFGKSHHHMKEKGLSTMNNKKRKTNNSKSR